MKYIKTKNWIFENNKNISEWGNVDFNINDYPLLKEVFKK